jgi:hypothetical protein
LGIKDVKEMIKFPENALIEPGWTTEYSTGKENTYPVVYVGVDIFEEESIFRVDTFEITPNQLEDFIVKLRETMKISIENFEKRK